MHQVVALPMDAFAQDKVLAAQVPSGSTVVSDRPTAGVPIGKVPSLDNFTPQYARIVLKRAWELVRNQQKKSYLLV